MTDLLTKPDAAIADPVLERRLFIDNEWRLAEHGKTFSLVEPGHGRSVRHGTPHPGGLGLTAQLCGGGRDRDVGGGDCRTDPA